jgi:hypothetical protein
VPGTQFLNKVDNNPFHGPGVTSRGCAPGFAQDPAVRIHHPRGHFGPADVDADGEALTAQPEVFAEGAAMPWPGRKGWLPPFPGRRASEGAGL